MGISCCESFKQFLEEENHTQFDKKNPKSIKKTGKDLSDNLKEEKYQQKIKNTENAFFGNFKIDNINQNDIIQPPELLNKDLNINEIYNISSNSDMKNNDDNLLDKNIIITNNDNLLINNGKEEINFKNEVIPQNDIINELKLMI